MGPRRSRTETAPVSQSQSSQAAEDRKGPPGPADTERPATLRRAATATARATLNTQRGATEPLPTAEASRGTAPQTPEPITAREVRAPDRNLPTNNMARAAPEDKAQLLLGDTPQAAPGKRCPGTQIHLPKDTVASPRVRHTATKKAATSSPHVARPMGRPQAAPGNLGPCTEIHLPKDAEISPPVAHKATQEAATSSPRMARHTDRPQAAPGDRGPSKQIHHPADNAVSPQPAHAVMVRPTRVSPHMAQPMDHGLPLRVTRAATAKATPTTPRTDRPRLGPVPGTPRPHTEDRPRPAPVGARSLTLPTPPQAPEPERDKEAANTPLLTAPPPRVLALLVPSTTKPSPGTVPVTVTANPRARHDQAGDRSAQLSKGSARREVTAVHGTGLDTLAPVST